ncbi:MAG: response regulator [Desulfobacteraceae bacterium]|nr:response regulator [Desulfobacteraceae bacterium]
MNMILAVDDEQKNLNAIKRIFSKQKHDLCFALNGEDALKQIETENPSIVILDIMMPGISGIETCFRIKEKDKNIMVLIVSANASVDDRLEAYTNKADDYLVKPYDPDELIAKVEILSRLYNAKHELKNVNQNLEETIKKRTEELIARERQAIVGKMVQGIVHNLRGPVSAAYSNVQLMGMNFDSFLGSVPSMDTKASTIADKIKKSNANVLKAIEKTSELIDTLLIQGGSNPNEMKRSLNLNKLIEKELKFIRSEIIMGHGARVELNLTDSMPIIKGVYSDFSQVFYNLAKNACEAMKDSDEKQINISSSCTQKEIIITFSDTGPGIDPAKLSSIFDPFFSTKSQSNETKSGSGLGLFVSSRLMAKYQGALEVKNNKDKGATFSIKIPLSNSNKTE